MADQDHNVHGLPIIAKTGINDTNLVTQTRAWYKTNGAVAIAGVLARINGKRLSFNLRPTPILAIHSNNRGQLFIQTTTTLFMYQLSDLLADEVISDIDGSVVIDDVTGQHVLTG